MALPPLASRPGAESKVSLLMPGPSNHVPVRLVLRYGHRLSLARSGAVCTSRALHDKIGRGLLVHSGSSATSEGAVQEEYGPDSRGPRYSN